jgi:hypothetical protein
MLGVRDTVDVSAPVLQLYVWAPATVCVMEEPAHTLLLPVTVSDGSGFTFTTATLLGVTPQPGTIPITVYEVVTLGVILIEALLDPLLHV